MSRVAGDQVSMSDVLMDFAEPLLRGLELPEDRIAFETGLKIAAMLWNASVDPSGDDPRDVYADIDAALGGGQESDREMERLFDLIIVRGRKLYPDVKRLIVDMNVAIGDDGTCRLNVVSGEPI